MWYCLSIPMVRHGVLQVERKRTLRELSLLAIFVVIASKSTWSLPRCNLPKDNTNCPTSYNWKAPLSCLNSQLPPRDLIHSSTTILLYTAIPCPMSTLLPLLCLLPSLSQVLFYLHHQLSPQPCTFFPHPPFPPASSIVPASINYQKCKSLHNGAYQMIAQILITQMVLVLQYCSWYPYTINKDFDRTDGLGAPVLQLVSTYC